MGGGYYFDFNCNHSKFLYSEKTHWKYFATDPKWDGDSLGKPFSEKEKKSISFFYFYNIGFFRLAEVYVFCLKNTYILTYLECDRMYKKFTNQRHISYVIILLSSSWNAS